MRLQEFRKKYPQYNDVPDKQLADSLYEKFYASAITKDDFYSQIGLTPAEPFAQPEPITGMESAFAPAAPTEGPKRKLPPQTEQITGAESAFVPTTPEFTERKTGVGAEFVKGVRGAAEYALPSLYQAVKTVPDVGMAATNMRLLDLYDKIDRGDITSIDQLRGLGTIETTARSYFETSPENKDKLRARASQQLERRKDDVYSATQLIRQYQQEMQAKYGPDSPEFVESVTNPNPQKLANWAAYAVGSGGVQLVPLMITAVTTGLVGVAAVSASMNVGEAFQNRIENLYGSLEGMTPREQADNIVNYLNRTGDVSLAVGIFSGALDALLGPAAALAKLSAKKIVDKTSKEALIAEAIKSAPRQMAEEGFTGGAQEAAQIAGGVRLGEKDKFLTKENLIAIINAAASEAVGSLAGPAIGIGAAAARRVPKGEPDVTIPPSQRPSPTISGEGIPISGRPERTLAPEGVAGAEPPSVGVPSVPAVEPVQGAGAPPPALDVRKEIDTLLDEYATIDPVAAGEFRTLFVDPNATYTQDDVDIVREIVNDARRLKKEETPQGAVEEKTISVPVDFTYTILQSPNYDLPPLTTSDTEFELDVLLNNAEKGRLTPENFAQSEIGKRLDTSQVLQISAGLKVDPIATITALKGQFDSKTKELPSAVTPTEAQQAKEEGAAAPAEGTEVAGAPTPAAKTADQLQDEIRDLEQQRLALLTKNGRVPAVKSKARAKYDALGEQVDALMGQWGKTDRAERAAKKPAEAPSTAPATTGKRTIEQVKQERNALLAEQQTLRTATGKPPAVRSPARRKYDALTERINQLYDEEFKLTPKEPIKVEEITTKDLQDRVANIKATIAETEAELAAATEDGSIEALENRLDALEKDLKNAQLDLREKIEAQREEGLLDIVEILLGGDEFQSGKSKKRAYIDNVGGAYNSQGEYIGNVLVTNPSLRRAVAKYYKQLKAGKITAEQYAEEVNRIYEETKQDKQATDLVRGQYNFRERMLRALRLGELPRVGVELAEWFISQNPRLLNDLAISIQQAKTEGPFAGAAGVYLPLPRIVRLFVGSVKDTTIIHEILHHLERLMPEEAQSAIRKMWLTSLVDRLKRNIPAAERRYLALIHKHVMGGGDAQALKQAMEMVSKGQVPYQMYQYINPSEFWAVNASEIVKGRYGGTFSAIARIKQWLSELVEKAKELFALPSNAPLIRALDSLAKADGSYKSEHLLAKNLDSYQSIVSGANDAIELDLTPTVIGAAASSKYEPDPAEAAFIESNLENKTLIQVGDWLAKNGPNAAYRVIASAATRKLRQLQRAGVTFNFKITHLGDKVPPGFAYSGRGYTQTIYGGVSKGTTNVYINGSDVTGRSGVAFYVALHELIHAATMSTIRLGRYKKINNVDLQNTDLHRSVKALYDVYGAIINHINNRKKTLPFDQLTEIEQDAIKSVNNAFDDPYEIISWALTWPEMQKYLDSIPYKNTNRSLWGAFVVAIRKLLNLPESTDSALSEILQVADELFNADIKELKNVAGLKGESLALAGPPPTPPGQQPPVRPLNPPGTVVNQSPQFPKPSPPGVLPGTNVPLNQPPPTPPGGQPPIVAGKKRPRGPRGPISGKSPWRTAEDATKTLTGVLNDALKGRTPWGKAVGSLAPAIWNPINSKLRRAFLFSATLRQLADITRFKFPQLVTAINIVDKMTSFRLGKLGEAQIIAKDWLDAQNKKPAQSTLVGRIMLDATINGKDPDKGPTGIANLDAAWASLDPEFQAIYRRVRDYFNNNLQEMIREMKKRVLKLPKAERQEAIRKINEQFAPDKLVFPYFPLRRFGEYWFQVGKGNFKEFYEFESEVTRELSRAARIRELKSGNAQQKALAETVDFGAGISELFSKNLASTQILKEVQDLIDSIVPPTGATSTKSAQDVRKELQDSLNQLIYIMLPQQSMRKMFINRKAVQGASSDMLRVFTDVAVHSAYQMARFKYGEDFINNINKARDYINEFFKPDARAVYRDFVNELEARTKTVLSAEDKSFLAKSAGTAGTFVFFSMLSAPFTALLNTLGFAVFTGSKLGGKYGYTEASEVMLKNMGRYWQTAPGRMLKPAAKGLMFQMQFPSIVEGGKLSPLLQRAADRFIAEGQIDVSLTNDIFDLTERPSELYTTRYNILKKILGGLFHQSERANREVALMSAFELEYNRLLNSPKRDTRGVIERDANGNPVTYTPDEAFEGAIQEAKHIAGLTLGDFSRQMKSRLFANVPLSVLLKFKQYAFMATYNYMRALQLSLSPLFDKKELNDIRDRFIQEKIPQAEIDQRMEDIKNFRRDIAKQSGKELLGILGVTFLFGGLEAMPFFWIALPAMFLMLASDDDKEDEESNYLNWFRNWADERLGGMSLARGPISQLIGGSLSERVSLDPLSMFYRDGRYSPDVVEGLIQDVIANAGPVVGLAMNWAEAAKLFGEGQYSRAWEKILPALFAKPIQAYRYGTEGATTRSGEEQLAAEKFSEWMLVMQAVGLQPEELALKQKSAIQAKEKEQKILAKETGLLNRLWLERDNAKGFDTALDKALQFYEKYPDMLPEDGDFSEKLMTSFEVRAEQIAEAEAFGARIDKRLRERIAPMLEYGQPKPKPPEKMTLEEVRQKYPQYNDVPDKELSDALKAKGLLK